MFTELKTPVEQFGNSLRGINGSLETVKTGLGKLETQAETHQQSLKSFAEAAGELKKNIPQLSESFKTFAEQSSSLKKLVTSQVEQLEKWMEKSEAAISQHETRMDASDDTVKKSVKTLEQLIDQGLNPLLPKLVGLSDLLTSLKETSGEFQKLLAAREQLEPILQGLSDASTVARDFEKLPDRFQHSLEEIPTRFEEMTAVMEQFSAGLLQRQIEDLEALLQPMFNRLAYQNHQTTLEAGNGNSAPTPPGFKHRRKPRRIHCRKEQSAWRAGVGSEIFGPG